MINLLIVILPQSFYVIDEKANCICIFLRFNRFCFCTEKKQTILGHVYSMGIQHGVVH